MGKVYRIQVEVAYSWAEHIWDWRVSDEKGDVVWHGTAMYRWAAKRSAVRAAKKHAKGKRMDDGTTENLDYHMFIP